MFHRAARPGPLQRSGPALQGGPAGDHATIGDALVDLLASPLAVNLIKVQAGVTNLDIDGCDIHHNVAMLFSDGSELRGALRWSETLN